MSEQSTLLATATASDAGVNKNCEITNNTSVSVVVLDAQGDDNAVPIQVVYEQKLTLMPNNGGVQALAPNATGTVVLDDWYTDNDDNSQQYSTSYELIVATEDCLFPVKATHARYILKSKSYNPITIAAADYTNMKLAEQFQQTLMAYPSSDMAKSFQAAMSGATNSAGKIEDIDTAVRTFFATTKEYKDVDLSMITAISTYYSQYPYVWGSYQGGKTYYLYGSDGNTVTAQGSIQIKVANVLPASTDKSLPHFTITYTDANGTTTPLYYVDGQFVDNKNTDFPKICLAGTFTLRSTLTKKATDSDVMAILAGVVNGTSVFGYDQKQKQDSDGNWSGLYTLLHPKDAMGWISLFMTATGLYMGLEAVTKGLKSLSDKFTKKRNAPDDQSDPNEVELEDMRSKAKSDVSAMETKYQELANKLDKNIEITSDLSSKMTEYQQKVKDQLNEDQRSGIQDELQAKSDAAGEFLDYGNTTAQKKLNTEIADTYNKVTDATTPELETVIPEVRTYITNTINVNYNIEVKKLSVEQQSEIQDVLDEVTQAETVSEEANEQIEDHQSDIENGETPEDIEFPEGSFQPGIFE